jgi:thiosulfate dehydrogenase [quinone] large subunit
MVKQQYSPLWQRTGLLQKDVELAYLFLRLVFGINFFNHGFTRIGNIGGFANSMVEQFKDTAVPAELVRIVGAIVPPVELVIGILLILGFATRGALIAGFILMMVLQGGVVILRQFDSAASQLIYCIIFFILLGTLGFNTYSLDTKFRRSRNTTAETV